MRRREALAGLAGVLGGLAGCPAQSTSVGDAGGDGVTPAPVPTATPTATATPEPECPDLFRDVDRVYCTPPAERTGPTVGLRTVRETVAVAATRQATTRARFALRNGTDDFFHTARDGWVLARREPGRWTVIDWGDGDRPTSVAPGGEFAWALGPGGGDGGDGSVEAPHEVTLPLSTGHYAFGVVGAFTGGPRLGLAATVAIVAGAE
ncbi:hypothetical protein [Haloarcula litorea]|uniref:hypothetical protein n=1 Tax=Haloarcula litorea TaxID=3032579 RepID=UPI0023E896DE|nr:hypothetical protein [Halomicroarcula sp. GDY20]